MWRKRVSDWTGVLRYVGVALLFLAVYAMVLRPVKKQALAAFKEVPSRALAIKNSALQVAMGEPSLDSQLVAGNEGAKRAATLKRQLTEKVKSEPAVASRLVQGWIRQEESK